MKKIGIITINDNNNYGNRLQNYAVTHTLQSLGFDAETLENVRGHHPGNMAYRVKKVLRDILVKVSNKPRHKRLRNFLAFNKYIKTSNIYFDALHVPMNLNDFYDYFVVGSDQVWNVNFKRQSLVDLLFFADKEKRVSISASFGIEELPEEYHEKFRKELLKFKGISVREYAGKKIVEDLTSRDDVEVLVDPTMLLTKEQWKKVSKKPTMLKTDRFILTYFLGDLSKERQSEIERIAKEKNCEIISILDKKSPFYQCGPSEFLYLEEHAEVICTDSFHSCVFAILFNKPFIIFDREGELLGMNSRLETLLKTFQLSNRKFNKRITKENMEHDYSNAYTILDNERERAFTFLKRNLTN